VEGAFFDLDKTLLPGSSLFPLAREMFRQRIITYGDIVRFALDQARYQLVGAEVTAAMERAREASLEAIRDRPVEEIVRFGRDVVNREIIPRFYPQAVELVARHKLAGRAVYICSSAPQDFLQLLADQLAIDGVVGTRAEVIGGRYTGRLDGPMVHGPAKADRLRALAEEYDIDLSRSFAYSDSVNDLPMLEMVGNPVAMNPDYRLRALARRRGWQVIDFRTARRRTMIASAAGAGAAASGAAGYAFGYLMGRRRSGRASDRAVAQQKA
jgi:HAD superfamily hydrolase (TIGR01490 family)